MFTSLSIILPLCVWTLTNDEFTCKSAASPELPDKSILPDKIVLKPGPPFQSE